MLIETVIKVWEHIEHGNHSHKEHAVKESLSSKSNWWVNSNGRISTSSWSS